jgi:hypothetical protein
LEVDMNGSELLHEAGAFVTAGWCQGAEARSARGMAVDVCDEAAASWSLLGALQAAAARDESTRIEDIRHAVAAIAGLIVDPSLAHWNDVPARTQAGVAALLGRAEALANTAATQNAAARD